MSASASGTRQTTRWRLASGRSTARLGLGVLAAAALWLALLAPAAGAAPTAVPAWSFAGKVGGVEWGSSQQTTSPLAFDSAGRLFVDDEEHESVAYYSLSGGSGTLLGRIPILHRLVKDIAVDPGTSALYASDPGIFSGIHRVQRYTSDGGNPPTYTLDPTFEAAEVASGSSIAVDPVSHEVLVGDYEAGQLRRYDTSGTLLSTVTPPLPPQLIAAAADGSVWETQRGAAAVVHLAADGSVLGEFAIAPSEALRSLAIAPSGNILVSYSDRIEGFTTAGTQLFRIPVSEGDAWGMTVSPTTGSLYTALAAPVAAVYEYTPATYPGAEPPTVTAVASRSAHVSAEVDPGAGPPAGSEAFFEYLPQGATQWKATPGQPLSGPTTIEADLTGIEANFGFQVRTVARNARLTHTTAAVSFTTEAVAPVVATGEATDVAETSAVLNGTVTPAGQQTTYHFEYGTSTAYGSRIPAGIDAVAGDGRSPRIFSRTIEDLRPGTTYHFRIVAENATGPSFGEDRTFTTPTPGQEFHRLYEQVTPVNKGGNPLETGIGFQAKADGSAFEYTYRGGTSSPLQARFMSHRTATNWGPQADLNPLLGANEATIVQQTVLAVSDDFTHTFAATNEKLTPDAGEASRSRSNLYVGDARTGEWTFVGTETTNFGFSFLGGFISTQMEDKYMAGAPDFSWLVFKSIPPLVAGAPFGALYRWSRDGGLEVVSKLPNGELTEIQNAGAKGPEVHYTSADGSRIYYTVFGGPEPGVYLNENGVVRPVSHPEGETGVPAPGGFLGTSADGRYAFFYSPQKLTGDGPESNEGVYRFDADDGSIEYTGGDSVSGLTSAIAVSRDGDAAYWRGANGQGVIGWHDGVVREVSADRLEENAFASPNGRYLGYTRGTSTNPVTHEAVPTVFQYDWDTDQTACLSCLSDGSFAEGYEPEGVEKFLSNRFSRVVLDDGRQFFTSSERLVAADVNGQRDVYEFHDGKVSLVSPGNGRFDAIFADVSEDGRNVFFTTNQKLVGQDNDQAPDVYDARVDGGLPLQNPPPPLECLRDDCKATPNAGPELPFGGSEAINGPQNVKPKKARAKKCGKGKVAKKVKGGTKCVKGTSKHATKAAKGSQGRGR